MDGYKNGGWKQKYAIFKLGDCCPECGGEGSYLNSVLGVLDCEECRGTGRKLCSTDPEAVYFVLRLDADPNARVALSAYADSVEAVNPEFARDIRQKLAETGEAFALNTEGVAVTERTAEG